MTKPRLLYGLWLLIPACIIACFWLLPSVPEPNPTAAERIESAVDLWWHSDDTKRKIPPADWPPELRQLDPTTVTVKADGVYVRFHSFLVEERGLFILPTGSSFEPSEGEGNDPSFRQIRGRIYLYRIKG